MKPITEAVWQARPCGMTSLGLGEPRLQSFCGFGSEWVQMLAEHHDQGFTGMVKFHTY